MQAHEKRKLGLIYILRPITTPTDHAPRNPEENVPNISPFRHDLPHARYNKCFRFVASFR